MYCVYCVEAMRGLDLLRLLLMIYFLSETFVYQSVLGRLAVSMPCYHAKCLSRILAISVSNITLNFVEKNMILEIHIH